jgi:hypothetical protein
MDHRLGKARRVPYIGFEETTRMSSSLQDIFSAETRALLDEESRLQSEMRHVEESLSGLRDIDLVLSLARIRLTLCMHLLKRLSSRTAAEGQRETEEQVTEKALGALKLVEGLLAENISEDQRGIIQANPLYVEVKHLLEQFLLAGGGSFLEAKQSDARKRRALSRSVVSAIRKYMGEDDRYPPLELENYPPFVRKALLFLFPVMVRENPEMPPYGIEEGGELTYSSKNMKLPLTQAIFYMENELLPELEKKLAESPGSDAIQKQIQGVRERAEDYKKLRFFPRSTPVLLEKGYYTEGMTGYTQDGEMLVPIPLPVTFKSGTNLDRKMELVRMDVVRRIAGRGVSGPIDEEYRRLRSLESGIRGSSRTASMKLDAAWGYRTLRRDFPFVARLSDKKRFQELVSMVQGASPGASERRISALIEKDEAAAGLLSPALESHPLPPQGSS